MSNASQQVPCSLAELSSLLENAPGFADVLHELHSGNSAAIDGAWGSACALSVATLAGRSAGYAVLVVLPGIRDVEEFFEEVGEFLPPGTAVRHFPAWETLPEEHDVTD